MEELKQLLEKNPELTVSDRDDGYQVTYMGVSTDIKKPSDDFPHYLVSGTTDYPWYGKLNKCCIKKNIALDTLVLQLVKFVKKQKDDDKQTPQNLLIDDSTIDNFNVQYYKLKSELLKHLDTSFSLIMEDSANVKKMYDPKTIGMILIGEYLKLWEQLKSSNTIKLSLDNNNLFSWKISMAFPKQSKLSDGLKKLKERGELDVVEIEMKFHGTLYPNYPPFIRIVRPILDDTLSHRIANSKMTQLAYWTPSRSAKYIIDRIYKILEKWGSVNNITSTEKTTQKIRSHHYDVMEHHLATLASVIDVVKTDDEIDKDETFIKFNINESKNAKTTNASTTKNYWKAGTGYGHDGQSSWDVSEYDRLHEEKNKQLASVITAIITDLNKMNNTSDDFVEVCQLISESLLLQYISSQFKNSTMLDMQQNERMFKLYISFVETICTDKSMFLFSKKIDGTSLYESLKATCDNVKNILKLNFNTNSSETEFFEHIKNLCEVMIFPAYDEYMKTIPKETTTIVKTETTSLNEKSTYVERMKKHVFEFVLDIANYNYLADLNATAGSNWTQCYKRLMGEITSFTQTNEKPSCLPLEYESSIFVRVNEKNPACFRAMITGPHDTPYDSACLIFDIYTGPSYPANCPKVIFRNHGGNRFNPNLYNCGKVCLSILGTWSGTSGETWMPDKSTLLQVLVSIQSLILIPQPYFNEPSYERSQNTPQGIAASKSYNDNIRLYVLSSAIRDLLKTPTLYPEFTDTIKEHFKLKKNHILKVCDTWLSEAPSNMKSSYTNVINEIKTYLEKY